MSEHYLLVMKFCTNIVLYNFYVKYTIVEKNVVVITKKSPMCQIMRFSFLCVNGSIEGKYITLKNCSNSTGCKSSLSRKNLLCVKLCVFHFTA